MPREVLYNHYNITQAFRDIGDGIDISELNPHQVAPTVKMMMMAVKMPAPARSPVVMGANGTCPLFELPVPAEGLPWLVPPVEFV